jgi:ATP-dependent DNA helicase RecG
MNNKSELENLILAGENSFIEFKREIFNNDSFAKECVAFSNVQGGKILIGVTDEGKIVGLSDNKIEEKIINICRNNIVPSIIPLIETLIVEEKKILIVLIEKGRFKPYKLKANNKYYIRIGSVSIEPSNEELIRLFQDGEQIHFEIMKIAGTGIKDLNITRFNEYCRQYRNLDTDNYDLLNLLSNLQVFTENNEVTIAGLLFFGKNIKKLLPQSGIELWNYDGLDKLSAIIDHKEIDDTIPELLIAAEKFVLYNSKKKEFFNGDETRRIDVYEYEPFVIRELVANALIHRDWSIFGQKLKVEMYNDRVEITSPGKIPNTLTLNKIKFGASYYRNPVIADYLRDYKIADKAGRGILKILTFFREHKLDEPVFESENEYFKVIIKKRI